MRPGTTAETGDEVPSRRGLARSQWAVGGGGGILGRTDEYATAVQIGAKVRSIFVPHPGQRLPLFPAPIDPAGAHWWQRPRGPGALHRPALSLGGPGPPMGKARAQGGRDA